MSETTVLMYHAVLSDPSRAEGADAHYAVSTTEFAKQMDAFVRQGFAVRAVRDLITADPADTGDAVAITFDDGHISNYEQAFPVLADRGLSGDFFVNSAAVGTASFVSWAALKEMSAAGMSIQSHGRTHCYLDDLGTRDIVEELSGSKREIEEQLGKPVELFAPPHGRFNGDVVRCAKEAGYRAMCCSRPGRWAPGRGAFDVPRLAVLGVTSVEQLSAWVRGAGVSRQVLRYRVLGLAKSVLGNQNYERLRERLLGSDGGS